MDGERWQNPCGATTRDAVMPYLVVDLDARLRARRIWLRVIARGKSASELARRQARMLRAFRRLRLA
jgi:hypothetical protein